MIHQWPRETKRGGPQTFFVRSAASAACFLALLSAASCNRVTAPRDAGTGTPDTGFVETVSARVPFGIGDVETGLSILATLDIKSRTRKVESTETITSRKDLVLVEMTVRPPWPEELWISFDLRKNGANFEGNVVVVKGEVLVDEVLVETFEVGFQRAKSRFLHHFEADVLAHLDENPKTMLVRAVARATLLEELDSVPEDLSALELPNNKTVTIRSNPVRIDFLNEAS